MGNSQPGTKVSNAGDGVSTHEKHCKLVTKTISRPGTADVEVTYMFGF